MAFSLLQILLSVGRVGLPRRYPAGCDVVQYVQEMATLVSHCDDVSICRYLAFPSSASPHSHDLNIVLAKKRASAIPSFHPQSSAMFPISPFFP